MPFRLDSKNKHGAPIGVPEESVVLSQGRGRFSLELTCTFGCFHQLLLDPCGVIRRSLLLKIA